MTSKKKDEKKNPEKKSIQQLGGEAVKKKYGKKHFQRMNEIRWGKKKKEDKKKK